MRRWLFTTIAICVAVVLVLWLSPLSASDPDVPLINAERIQRGIPALKEDSGLDSCARAHSQAMAQKGYIYHNLNETAYRCAGSWTEYGENVGAGSDVETVHRAFMNSPEHRYNMLCRCFHIVGAGEAYKDSIVYVTEIYEARITVRPTPRPVEPRKPPPAIRSHPRPVRPSTPLPGHPKRPPSRCTAAWLMVAMLMEMERLTA